MQIDNVNGFVYLGTWDNECSKEIKHVSVQVYVYVFNVLLCASETWTLKKLDKDRLLAFEMKCYRWILHIRWQQKIRNEEMSQQKRISDHNTEKTPQFFGLHLPNEVRTNVKSHSVWCDGGQSTERETMWRMDG